MKGRITASIAAVAIASLALVSSASADAYGHHAKPGWDVMRHGKTDVTAPQHNSWNGLRALGSSWSASTWN